MKVTTESGSVYEIRDEKVRRVGTHDLRRDGDWLQLFNNPHIEIGESMLLMLEPLGNWPYTPRLTSRVTEIQP